MYMLMQVRAHNFSGDPPTISVINTYKDGADALSCYSQLVFLALTDIPGGCASEEIYKDMDFACPTPVRKYVCSSPDRHDMSIVVLYYIPNVG